MATAGDGMKTYESKGAGEKFGERPFLPEINEEPQNVSQEAYRNAIEEQIASPVELPKISMASRPHPATMEDLPEELLLNIFIRLLAKQLAQMRYVSRYWNALISHSSFVKSHLNRSIHDKDKTLMVFYNKSSNFKPFTAHQCLFPHLELSNFIKLPVNPQSEQNIVKIIGSLNGLICSSYSDSVIHIWNPSLSAVLTLPPSSLPPPTVASGYGSTIIYRFGFDPKTDDYKVVKIIGLNGPTPYFVKWWLQIEIYSMREGSWEFITERFPSHITWIFGEDRLGVDGCDGHLHWLSCTNEELDSKTILAFDLSSETFREIPLPHSKVDNENEYLTNLGVLNGKLCYISHVFVDEPCEVWVMEEYGVAESWVKRHVFLKIFGDYIIPFGFTSHNEFLVDVKYRLVLFDPIANKAKILVSSYPHNPDKFVEYVDSLVWVAPAEREMVDRAPQN